MESREREMRVREELKEQQTGMRAVCVCLYMCSCMRRAHLNSHAMVGQVRAGACARTCTYTCTHAHMCVLVQVHVREREREREKERERESVCVCVCVRVRVRACVHMCMICPMHLSLYYY